MGLWLTLFAMGLVTVLIRLSMIALLGRFTLPEILQRALRYVPPAVLAAIILPEMLQPGGTLDVSLGNERLLAGFLAVLVAWRTKNTIFTIVTGMTGLWLLTALGV